MRDDQYERSGLLMKNSGLPTANMISEIAGVSKSTVSRALAGHPSIPEATRKRILAVAKKIGYEPNAMARSLTSTRSGVLGLVIGEMENPFYQEHLERLARITAETGMQIMLFQVPKDGDLIDVVPGMARYRLDGCIVIASVPTSEDALEACDRYNISVVLLNRILHSSSVSSVLCNNLGGGREIARFLLDAGHERIALLRGREDSIVNRDRCDGFCAAMAEAGAEIYADVSGEFRFSLAYRRARELMDRDPSPDAIFAVSDLMACGVIDALRDLGMRVPDDISVVGFDGIRSARWPAYRLTSFEQPIDTMLRSAVRLLCARLEDPERTPEIAYINGQLRIRRSSRVPTDRQGRIELDGVECG